MGRIFAEDLSASELSLSEQITYHLRGNHYPPVPVSMVTPCVEAINAYNTGDPDQLIELPDGISWRGESTAPASAIINAHHLESWLGSDEAWDELEMEA